MPRSIRLRNGNIETFEVREIIDRQFREERLEAHIARLIAERQRIIEELDEEINLLISIRPER